MTLLEAAAGRILPPEYSDLILRPINETALAFRPELATVVTTSAATFNLPIVEEDAGAAWVAEGKEITPDDPVLGELPVTPSRLPASRSSAVNWPTTPAPTLRRSSATGRPGRSSTK